MKKVSLSVGNHLVCAIVKAPLGNEGFKNQKIAERFSTFSHVLYCFVNFFGKLLKIFLRYPIINAFQS